MNAVGYFDLKSDVTVWLHDRDFVKTFSECVLGKRDCFRVNCDYRLLNNASNPLPIHEGNAEKKWRHQRIRRPRLYISCLYMFSLVIPIVSKLFAIFVR
jgi:hypothetical protein